MKKRVLSIAVSLFTVLLLSVGLSVTALAADVVASGSCGTGVTWTLDSEGLLTISGTGAMQDYSIGFEPWHRERGNITGIKIADRVTSIGRNAFYDCSNLTEIELPDSLIGIGESAFRNCSSLTSIVLPDNVIRIGDSAFKDCSSLSSIEIPDSLLSIGDYAFADCSSLTGIVIPGNVTSIGDRVFLYCSSLTSIVLPENVTSIGYEAFYYCSSLTSIVIPGNVTSIGDYAFYGCTSLKDIYYIGTAEQWAELEIGSGNDNLTNAKRHYSPSYEDIHTLTVNGQITLNTTSRLAVTGETIYVGVMPPPGYALDTVLVDGKAIDGVSFTVSGDHEVSFTMKPYKTDTDIAFGTCGDTMVWCLYRDGELRIDGVGTMENHYSGSSVPWSGYCERITHVTIADGVENIGYSAFENFSNLTSIKLPDGLTSIGYAAFKNCDGLTGIELPDGVTEIGTDAFADCDSLTSIKLSDGLISIGERAFSDCGSLTTIELPDGLTTIGSSAFSDCGSLTSIKLPGDLTRIRSYTFYNCSGLVSIELPDSLTSIDDGAFYCCTSLAGIILPQNVTTIDSSAFSGCASLTGVAFSSGVTSIGSSAFANTALADVFYVGGSDRAWERIAFNTGNEQLQDTARHDIASYADIRRITIDQPKGGVVTADKLLCVNGMTVNVAVKKPPAGCLPDKILVDGREISGNRFTVSGNHTVSATFKRVYDTDIGGTTGDAAYWALTDDNTLYIYGTGEMENYYDSAPWYAYRNRISKAVITPGVTSIGYEAFYCCSNLTSVAIPTSVKTIGGSAFDGCSGLKDVYYAGSRAEWGAIAISYGNNCLAEANIHYQSDIPEPVVPGDPDNDQGIRVEGLEDSVPYTGKAVTQVLQVYGKGNPLTEGKDYTVSYKNNKNVGDATVTIKFKGTYKKEKPITLTFHIYGIALDGLEVRWNDEPVDLEDGITVPFTGKAQKLIPALVNPENGVTLKAKTDYTITYEGKMTNVGEENYIVLTGKGGYEGQIRIPVHITTVDLSGAVISPIRAATFTGKPVTPKLTVKLGKTTLKQGVHFMAEFSDNVNTGTAAVTIHGIGNYEGTCSAEFLIKGISISKAKMSGFVSSMPYEEGEEAVQHITLTYGGETLTEGEDYTVTYENNDGEGTATMYVNGEGNFHGTQFKKTFKITKVAIKKAKVSGLVSSMPYTGEEVTQEGYELVYTVKGAEPMVLEEGEDYTVRYEKNVKAGTATIYFDGCGRFSGTLKKTFKITPVMVADSDEIAIRVEDGVLEDGKPVTPEVSVYFKDEELTLGKDYTVKYSNNKAVASAEDAKAPTVTITFKGSFKGKLTKTFNIMK